MTELFGAKPIETAQRGADNGSDLYDKAKDKVQSVIHAGREGVDAVTEQGRRQVETVSSAIRDWPLLSVGIAFAAGCLVSRLFHR